MKLKGKIIIKGKIKTCTGLHIGAANPTLEVGGIDLPVVRSLLDNMPIISGSSLRGKMRSLLEKYFGKDTEKKVQENPPVRIHECETYEKYKCCEVCPVFGVSSDVEYEVPSGKTTNTRLIIRDAKLSEKSAEKLNSKKTELPYTEAKLEITVDRITSQATPRTVERVPAGTTFNLNMVFNLFEEQDNGRFEKVFLAMHLLEDDYLGGGGARGSGRIKFENLSVILRSPKYYKNGKGEIPLKENQTVSCLQDTLWSEKIEEKLAKEEDSE